MSIMEHAENKADACGFKASSTFSGISPWTAREQCNQPQPFTAGNLRRASSVAVRSLRRMPSRLSASSACSATLYRATQHIASHTEVVGGPSAGVLVGYCSCCRCCRAVTCGDHARLPGDSACLFSMWCGDNIGVAGQCMPIP